MQTQGEARLPLRRPQRGRALGGVAAGLAAHLGLPVVATRIGLLLLVPLGGVGLALYGFWWFTIPPGDPEDLAAQARPAAASRLAPRLSGPAVRVPRAELALGLLLVAVAGVAFAAYRGQDLVGTWVLPTLIALGGAGLAWSQLDDLQRHPGSVPESTRSPVSAMRLVGGALLAGLGVFLLVGRDEPVVDLVRSALAALAVLIGAALVAAPWWLRLVRALSDERLARARESERADIAAHLHDSVLQTLALIRVRATDCDEVARLARAQERELRTWLYDDRPTPGTSVVADLRDIVAEIEDQHGAAIEVVAVGDRVPDARSAVLLRATREAMVNAVQHGSPPVSVYLEVGPGAIEVFVKDRGEGFDLEAIPDDRLGVRESIIGRMRRNGGSARVRSLSGGTEVELQMTFDEGSTT